MKLATMEAQGDVCLIVQELNLGLFVLEGVLQLPLLAFVILGFMELYALQQCAEMVLLLVLKFVMMGDLEDVLLTVPGFKQITLVLLEATSLHQFVLAQQDITFLLSIVLQFVEMDLQLDQKFVMMEIWEDVCQIVLVHSKNSFATGEVK